MAASCDKSVLFICLGNICRSPIAEAVFLKLLKEKGLFDQWRVDSAAIGSWHVGSKADSRAISVLERNNIEIKHRARQIEESDFHRFKFILGMDEENMSDLKRLAPSNSSAKLQLLGCYDPSGELIIEDPYYTKGEKAFFKTLEHCTRACEGFLNAVLNEK
ncbi:low molecular weight phosphotyrosine protein phosphatase [Halyomorpha halys]|uniref:low molecular weight phosphotyrosine protein phosphatase n=1 Tax=Halyomorpha halys TaxID=286706 RepID=UPI0006D528EB|nr:low molecular weight phosphotyrosine protein phosphatase [Halyomorpha halys]